MNTEYWEAMAIIGVLVLFVVLIVHRADQRRANPQRFVEANPSHSGDDMPGQRSGNLIMSAIFLVISVLTILGGWWRMYAYDEFSDKIVGGDAYNYSIIATRGAGIITAGVGFAVIAIAFAVFAVAERLGDR